LRRRKNTIYFK